jgi:hypothetical protein
MGIYIPPTPQSIGAVPVARQIIAGINMSGGGNLSADVTLNASGGGSGSIESARFWEQQASGSGGGASTAYVGDYLARVLNQSDINILGASLNSNQITLPAGTYTIDVFSPVNRVNHNKIRLYNITDDEVTLLGMSCYSPNNSTVGGDVNGSCLKGIFSINDIKTFEIQLRCETNYTTNSEALGNPCGFGDLEIYTQVLINKI